MQKQLAILAEKSHNNKLQGTSRQRGFPKFNLAAKVTDKSKFSAANPACP
jgi:hypothetical protein